MHCDPEASVMLERHLRQLTDDLELDPVGPKNREGFYDLPLLPGLTLSLKELDPGFYILCPIILCPVEKREALFIHLMKANFLGLATGGAAIGLDTEEKFLTLSHAIPYDVNYKSFKETIEDFANYLDFWQQEVTRHQKAAEEGIL